MPSLASRNATVRLLCEQDIAAAAELSSEAGWNQTPHDWRMLLRLNPEGCFGIDADGHLVSTTTLVTYGSRLGWIGMVLTNPSYHRRGFARTLLLRAIEKADQLGVESLKLDATDQGLPLYESLGFRVEQAVERWWRTASYQRSAMDPAPYSLADDVVAYAVDRAPMLTVLADRSTIDACADAFCFSRPGRQANYIGPCIARSPESARQLIKTCAASESYWDLLPQNETARSIAIDLGFAPRRRLVRMVRGRDLRGREDWIYAIAGFELG